MVKSILIIAVLALAGLLLFAATRPDTFSLQRSIVIQAPPDKIHALINELRQFNTWNPYDKKDPAMQGSYRGPAAGPGARYEFKGNKEVGEGSLEITVRDYLPSAASGKFLTCRSAVGVPPEFA